MRTGWIKWALLGLGIALVVCFGWLGGEATLVMRKAIYICLECMGLGA